MKTIQKTRIDGHIAELILSSDSNTLQIVMDNNVIETFDGYTWDNIKNEVWAQKGLLTIVSTLS